VQVKQDIPARLSKLTTMFDDHMNTSRKIGLAAILLFAISHFLPAFGGLRGYSCFQECWKTMIKHDMAELVGWLYYSGFVLSNITFLVEGVTSFDE
jgi:hypothetical protein